MRRYPGTGPFGPDDAARFFGRRSETEELYLRILSVPLLLQFGKSGLGKTSLLQAGLFPLLRAKAFLPVMIRLNDPRESLNDAVARSIRESVVNEGVDIEDDHAAGLWQLLDATTIWRGDLLLTPVLVFDQFEEVFTLRDPVFREELAEDLGAIVQHPEVKLLISLKETHLGELEQFSARIPRLFQERLRLEPLSESAARDAIVKPAQLEDPEYATKPFTYDAATLDNMLTYLKGHSDVIEPFQLQLLCQHAEGIAQRRESTQSGPVTLTMNDFKGSNAFAVVLENFYRDVLAHISSPVQRKRAAALCEDGLLGSSGQRLMLEKAQVLNDYGVSEETLRVLGHERLIREERRMESTFYELSHDRIAESVFAARSQKLPKSVKRALWISGAAALVVGAVLVMVALLAWNNTVEKERDRAENLLGFLLGEQFLGEVRDVGRSTLLLQVQDEVERRGVGRRSALNRGLSLRNRGEIRRTEGSVEDAVRFFRESLKAFESAPETANAAREIARAHDRLGSALVTQGKLSEALPHILAADRYWRIVANTPGPVDVVRTDCTSMAESLVSTVEIRTRMGESRHAQQDLEKTFTVLSELMFGRGEAPPECGPLSEQAAPYPDPDVMKALTRAALARAVLFASSTDHEGAAALAEQARMLRPSSSSARETVLMTLTWRAQMSRSVADALTDFQRVLAESEELRRSDPDNRLWQRDRATAQLLVSQGIVACQREPGSCTSVASIDDAEALVFEAIATLRTLASTDATNTSLQLDLVHAAQARSEVLAARGGHAAERLAVLRNAQQVCDRAMRDRNDAATERLAVDLLTDEADILLAMGRDAEAGATLSRALDRARKLVRAHPDDGMSSGSLAMTLAREQHRLRTRGDDAGVARVTTEMKDAASVFLDRYVAPPSAASDALRNRGHAHVRAGQLVAAETAFRGAIRRLPTSYETYDELRHVYQLVQQNEARRGRKAERFEALRASMHAAQIAAWLAPEAKQSAMNERLLDARSTFAHALIAEKDRGSNEAALGLMQEAVVVASGLVQREPGNDRYRFSLAAAKCDLGMGRRKVGIAGWENAIRSGLIDVQRAIALAPDRIDDRVQQGAWRQYLGEQLSREGAHESAAAALSLALQSYEEVLRLDPNNVAAQRGVREVRALQGSAGVASAASNAAGSRR